MKTLHLKCFIAAAALAAVCAPASANEPARQREEAVTVIVEGVTPDVARAIKRRAALGRSVLIAYLDRGRFTYEVRVEQVAKDANANEQLAAAAKPR
jgi:hypothetical protein